MISIPKKILFCLGAQKAGTSWLYRNISQSQSVYSARKELHYFTRANVAHHGLTDYYSSLTLGSSPFDYETKYFLDFSTSYYSSSLALDQLSAYALNPGNTFLFIYRNPVERFISHLLNDVAAGKISISDISEFTSCLSSPYVKNSDYLSCCSFLDAARRALCKVVIINFDSIISSPEALMLSLSSHLDLNLSSRQLRLGKVNSTRFLERSNLDRLIANIAHHASILGLESFRKYVRDTGLPELLRNTISINQQAKHSMTMHDQRTQVVSAMAPDLLHHMQSQHRIFLSLVNSLGFNHIFDSL